MKNLIITSGYFNPISDHHLDYLKSAKHLFDTPTQNKLVVIVNNDRQVELKGSVPFQDEQTRSAIICYLEFVDEAYISWDEDESISETIKEIYQQFQGTADNFYFANGGPRIVNSKEVDICNKLGIKCLHGVGGDKKIGSSSWLIERAAKLWLKKKLELDIDD